MWEPVILLWPEGVDKKMWQPAALSVKLHICDDCRKFAQPLQFLNEEVWKKIKVQFYAQGKAQPSLKNAEITFMMDDSYPIVGLPV
jgi:hypothetical protein